MKPRRPAWLNRPVNKFRLTQPSQALIARATKAGITPLTIPNIKAWFWAGEPTTWRNDQ